MFINFIKMHGLGNDFVVIDLITQPFKVHADQIKRIAHRQHGIGADQILLIEPPIRPSADFYVRIFNQNGQEVEQCGNGIRCASRFFYETFGGPKTVYLDCKAGPLTAVIEDHGHVTVNMGIPKFKPADIPFRAEEEARLYPLHIDDQEVWLSLVSMGNPHAVLKVLTVEEAPVAEWGPLISQHPLFPEQVNVGFLEILSRDQIRLRVYERGAGETLACGTGGCAAVAAGIRMGVLDNTVQVHFKGGDLTVEWAHPQSPLYMTGPTQTVFIGRFKV